MQDKDLEPMGLPLCRGKQGCTGLKHPDPEEKQRTRPAAINVIDPLRYKTQAGNKPVSYRRPRTPTADPEARV